MSAEAMSHVFRHSPYKGTALLVHLAVADAVNDLYGHEFWASQGAVGDKARTTRETASRTMGAMVDDGHLELLEDNARRGEPNRYRFIFKVEGVMDDHREGVMNDHTRGDIPSQGGVMNDHTEPKREPKETDSCAFPTAEAVRLRRHPYPDPFEAFWTAYPRNVGKMAAYKAWLARVADAKKQHIDQDRRVAAMTAAAEGYAADCDDHRRAEEHIMHAATFLGPTDRWRDYARKPTTTKASDVPSWATGQRAHG